MICRARFEPNLRIHLALCRNCWLLAHFTLREGNFGFFESANLLKVQILQEQPACLANLRFWRKTKAAFYLVRPFSLTVAFSLVTAAVFVLSSLVRTLVSETAI